MAKEGQRKIMIAVDGSDAADNAFDWYMRNMKQPEDYVYGITVPEYNFSGMTVGPMADPQALSQQFQEQHKGVEKLCADYTAKLRSSQIAGQVDSCPGGKPGETIVEQAEKLGVDSVVMGTRGHNMVKRLILGSVSNYVVHNCNVPVSVIPLKEKK